MTGRALAKDEFAAKLRAELASRPAPPPPPKRKRATVEAYRHFTHIFSHAVYRATVGDPKGYTAFLDAEPAREVLGRAVHEALAASRFITPDHPEWDTVMRLPTEGEVRAQEDDLETSCRHQDPQGALQRSRTGFRHHAGWRNRTASVAPSRPRGLGGDQGTRVNTTARVHLGHRTRRRRQCGRRD